MDDRLKHIADHFETMRIGADDSFRFHCTQCGKCCINREDILLCPKDIYNIAKHLSISQEEVVRRYCETYQGQGSRLPLVRLKPRGSIKRCPLLEDQKCMVHQAKPVVCAMFPIGRCIRLDQNQAKHINTAELKTEFIFTSPGCGDGAETHTVREWLASFGIPVEDPDYVCWQRVAIYASTKIREFETRLPKEDIDILLSLLFGVLYLGYDMNQEFGRQFADKSKRAIAFLRNLTWKERRTDECR